MNFELPHNVKFIINILRSAGYEAYAVGGCVRDMLLNRKPNDWDITTSALPLQVKELFKKTVDTGIKHGTVTVIMGGSGYEVTTYRIDGDYNDCRHPESVTFTANLAEDLRRRDFTINAFVYNEEEGVIDLFKGIDDLNNKIIRCVGVPEERFTEDALRILRAVRFAAQLSFSIDGATMKAASLLAPNLTKVSAERIHVELEKLLVSSNPEYICLLNELGLDSYTLPELYRAINDGADKDNLSKAIKSSSRNKYVRWSVLASFVSEGTFEPTETAKKMMRRLKSDNYTIDYIAKFIELRDFCLCNPSDYDLRKLLNKLGDKDWTLFIDFIKANYILKNGLLEDSFASSIENISHRLNTIVESKECTCIKQLAINGRDLISNGFPQGKELGDILDYLLEKVLMDQSLNAHDTLLQLAKSK